MASSDQEALDSDEPEGIESSNIRTVHTPMPEKSNRQSSPSHSVLSHRFRESPQKTFDHGKEKEDSKMDHSIRVLVPAPQKPWEYETYQGDITVDSVLEEIEGPDGKPFYKIEYEDGRKNEVSVILLDLVKQMGCFILLVFSSKS